MRRRTRYVTTLNAAPIPTSNYLLTQDQMDHRKSSQTTLPCLPLLQSRHPHVQYASLHSAENGQPRRYIELKGILEIDIKSKTCKVDYNMMLPFDYPRSPPFVRIVNRNPDYTVDPFYQSLKSKTDPSSYVLNDKLASVKGWQPSSSLVHHDLCR